VCYRREATQHKTPTKLLAGNYKKNTLDFSSLLSVSFEAPHTFLVVISREYGMIYRGPGFAVV
jgi:hypothetical protein